MDQDAVGGTNSRETMQRVPRCTKREWDRRGFFEADVARLVERDAGRHNRERTENIRSESDDLIARLEPCDTGSNRGNSSAAIAVKSHTRAGCSVYCLNF